MIFDYWADWFRILNAVLAIGCIVGMIITRSAKPALRPFTTVVCSYLGWQAYTSIEVILTPHHNDVPAGLRVFGFSILLAALLIVLICDKRAQLRNRKGAGE